LFWLSCIIYTMSYNFTTHATCLLKLMVYKYSELQMSFITQKLSCKASCKTPFFLIVIVWQILVPIPSFMHHGGNLKNNFHWNFVIDDDLCFNLTLCYEINANMNDITIQQNIILIYKALSHFYNWRIWRYEKMKIWRTWGGA
jgi:hypothetical protein